MGEDILSDPVLAPLAGPDGTVRLRSIVLRERIGAGGMGAIYLGHHEKLDIDIAVKILAHAQAGGGVAIERFLLEARMAARIDHPSLVRVHDVDEEKGLHYIVMEYVRGHDAGKLVTENGPFGETRALEIARGAGDALRAAHEKGIVHRDVKPENILIREEDGAVKLADLGLAKAPRSADSERLTATGQVFGTPAYMSPEQIESPGTVDARADVYSLGATLYTLLSGKRPFVGDSVISVIHSVCDGDCIDIAEAAPSASPGACQLVRRMMRLKAAERPSSMAQAVGQLDRLLQRSPEAPTAAVAPPAETIDVRRLEEKAMRAEAMGDFPSALKQYRQILDLGRVDRVENRAREIEGMLPLWRAKQAAGACSPGGRWDVEEELVGLARGLAAFKHGLCAVQFPSLERGWERETRQEVTRVAADGRALVVGYANGRVERVGEGGEILWDVRPSRKALRSLAVCAAGGLAAAGYVNGTVAFIRLADGKVIQSSRGHSGAVEELAFLESGGARTVVSLGADGVMKRWHPSGKELGVLTEGAGGPASFSPTTAVARVGEDLFAWRPPWKEGRALIRCPEGVSALALDPADRVVLFVLGTGEMLIYSTAVREELWRVRALDYEPRGLFFAGERTFAAWSAHEARAWNLGPLLAGALDALQC